MFQRVDTSVDGTIDKTEFAQMDVGMYGMPFAVDATQNSAAFDTIDQDQTGTIDLREFCTWSVVF
jgi:hypothetical protein